MASMDMIIGRKGDSLSGRMLDKSCRVQTTLGTLKIDKGRIAWIHFGILPGAQPDEIWLHSGDRLAGKVLGGKLKFRDLGGTTLDIPFTSIHTLLLGARVDPKARPLG